MGQLVPSRVHAGVGEWESGRGIERLPDVVITCAYDKTQPVSECDLVLKVAAVPLLYCPRAEGRVRILKERSGYGLVLWVEEVERIH